MTPFIQGLASVHVSDLAEANRRLARFIGMPSTVIRGFDYRPATGSLDVTFVSGRRYRYLGVPEEVARGFREAFSKGRFFNARIRDEYRYTELNDAPVPSDELWAL